MGVVSLIEAIRPIEDRPPGVAVVARDELVRRRVASALRRDGQLVPTQTASADELQPEHRRHAHAVVIAGRTRADERATAIRAAKTRLPEARVVVVATTDANGVHKALEAGADGFVLDCNLEATLATTVRAVCSGQLALPPMGRASAVRPPLSHREKQTLDLLVLGLTNAEIARRLYLAESTVKCHLTSIFSKLGVRSRNEAIARKLHWHDAVEPDIGDDVGDVDRAGVRS
jgi:DNA-binding NarL/FixJ family response regulator